MKKEMPAPTAARKAIHETTFGLTRSIREATGTRNQSAALRYRSRTIAPVLVLLGQRPSDYRVRAPEQSFIRMAVRIKVIITRRQIEPATLSRRAQIA